MWIFFLFTSIYFIATHFWNTVYWFFRLDLVTIIIVFCIGNNLPVLKYQYAKLTQLTSMKKHLLKRNIFGLKSSFVTNLEAQLCITFFVIDSKGEIVRFWLRQNNRQEVLSQVYSGHSSLFGSRGAQVWHSEKARLQSRLGHVVNGSYHLCFTLWTIPLQWDDGTGRSNQKCSVYVPWKSMERNQQWCN